MSNPHEHPAASARESTCELAASVEVDIAAARLLAELPAPALPGDERAAAASAYLIAAAAVVAWERSGEGAWRCAALEACHVAGQASRALGVALGLVGGEGEVSADWSSPAATEACEIEEGLWHLFGRLGPVAATGAREVA